MAKADPNSNSCEISAFFSNRQTKTALLASLGTPSYQENRCRAAFPIAIAFNR